VRWQSLPVRHGVDARRSPPQPFPLVNMPSLELIDRLKGFTLPLRDGELVDFRPVRPDDRETLIIGMSALSLQSRYFRFFSPIAQLSDAQLHYFTAADQQNHVAWIALAHDEPEHPGLGIARFIRLQNQPEIAEFALVVIDSHQQLGLGTLLLAVLYRLASLQGIDRLRGFILPENTVMSHWLGRLGAAGCYENGIYRMDLAVAKELSGLPGTPTGRRFRECIRLMPTMGHVGAAPRGD
jgi:GNAT superfamily N-acetyltransferase